MRLAHLILACVRHHRDDHITLNVATPQYFAKLPKCQFFDKVLGPRKIQTRLKPIIIVSLKTRLRITVEIRQIKWATLDQNIGE